MENHKPSIRETEDLKSDTSVGFERSRFSTPLKEKLIKAKNSNHLLIKIAVSLFILGMVATAAIFAINYYKNNFTPEAIIRKSLANFVNSKKIKYKGKIKVVFSYSDTNEKLDVGGGDVYSLLKSSNSDENNLDIEGEYGRSASPSGKLTLTWNSSTQKLFTIDANYIGSNFKYKVTPYIYSGLVDESSKTDYQSINTSEIFKKILGDQNYSDLKNIKSSDFSLEKSDIFQDDVINGEKAYHYKVKLMISGSAAKLAGPLNGDQLDLWIGKKSLQIVRVQSSFDLNNVGSQGNTMVVYYDLNFSN